MINSSLQNQTGNSQSDPSFLVQADDFSSQPSPIEWLVKRWIQKQALHMIHGPSGGGKTFTVLDMCLRIAAGKEEWMEHRVTHGSVVYLAGEGHHGLRGRIAAWKHHNAVSNLSMWLSQEGCSLNTPDGFTRVVTSIKALPEAPAIIVVDTLHRFLEGDENSAQDAKTMLDACGALMREFSCSVILIHHTGISETAQDRARGSSAWRGALDIEISVTPASDGEPIKVTQKKSKDSESPRQVRACLTPVAIPGWYDEDGEQVSSAVLSRAPDKKAKIAVPLKTGRPEVKDEFTL